MARAFSAETDKPAGDFPATSGNDILVGSSIQAAVNAAANSDRILIPPGFYNEAVVVPVTLSNVVLAVLGGKGSVAIKPSAVDAVALTVHSPSAVLYGITGTGNGVGGGIVLTGRGIRAKKCKGEGGAFGVAVKPNPAELGDMSGAVLDTYGNPMDDGSDIELEDCEYAWATNGLIVGGAIGTGVTELYLKGGLFHNNTTTHIIDGAGPAMSSFLAQHVIFAVGEAGAQPTKILTLNRTDNTGQLVECYYAIAAASLAANIQLAAGVLNVGAVTA